jgi:D-beta-D-heptose 7-phosphate kinase/D-beta-D-heptose 1-phosphate adenosyltransferase
VLETKLRRLGVGCDLVRLPGQATITKLRVLSRNQQLLRLDFEDGFPGFEPAALQDLFRPPAGNRRRGAVRLWKGALREIEHYILAARIAGKPVLVDPKGRDFGRYRGATLLTPNLAEFEAVVGPCRDEAELVGKGEALRRDLELDAC